MSTEASGGTRWRPTFILLLPALLCVLVLAALTFLGGMPLNLAISGQDFKVTSRPGSKAYVAYGASGFADLAEMKDGSHRPSLKAGVKEAEISDGVCVSLVLTFPKIGTYTVQVQTKGYTKATNVEANASFASGRNAEIQSETSDGKVPQRDLGNVVRPVRINVDASELEGISGGHTGVLGLDAPGPIRATDLQVVSEGAVIGGTVRISGIGMPRISQGRGTEHGECF